MDAAFLRSLLPADAGVRITAVTVTSGLVSLTLATTGDGAACPPCGAVTTAVHGRYRRALHDRPCLGLPVAVAVTARKFACPRADCPRRVFRERLPELAEPHARTTGEPTAAHRRIGLALGGEAGARVAAGRGLPTRPDTILRRVRDGPDEPAPPPRFVGIDDWATRKGHTYGTILVDLERGTVIDLLPGRDGEALEAWLAANPQVEVITRDRWPAYIQAATTAAPQAKQVADRFHLLTNVREAVEKILSRVAADVRAANAAVNAPGAAEAPAAPEPAAPPTDAQQRPAAKRQPREERVRRVKALTAAGLSVRQIARQLRMSRGAVLRYRRLDRCPDWRPGRTPPTAVDPFAAFVADGIAAGNRNSRDRHRALRAKGFTGGYDAARRYLNRRIGSTGRPSGRRRPRGGCRSGS